jgi:hypothetical protein
MTKIQEKKKFNWEESYCQQQPVHHHQVQPVQRHLVHQIRTPEQQYHPLNMLELVPGRRHHCHHMTTHYTDHNPHIQYHSQIEVVQPDPVGSLVERTQFERNQLVEPGHRQVVVVAVFVHMLLLVHNQVD